MFNEMNNENWKTLERLTRLQGFLRWLPVMRPYQHGFKITGHPSRYLIFLFCLGCFGFGVFVAAIPLIVKTIHPECWPFLRNDPKIFWLMIIIFVLSTVYLLKVLVEMLRLRKIILNPHTGEMELHYGYYFFPRKLVLLRGHFEPAISHSMIVLSRIDQPGHAINLFFYNYKTFLAYEKIMVFAHGRIPEELKVEFTTHDGRQILFSKAPLQKGTRTYDPLNFRSPTPDQMILAHSNGSAFLQIGFGTFLYFASYVYDSHDIRGYLVFVVGAAIALFGVLDLIFAFKYREFIVDRLQRTLTIYPHIFDRNKKTKVYPFDQIAALQLCKNRMNNKITYVELNLISAEQENDRVTLAITTTSARNQKQMQKLAEFIGKPLLDYTEATNEPRKSEGQEIPTSDIGGKYHFPTPKIGLRDGFKLGRQSNPVTVNALKTLKLEFEISIGEIEKRYGAVRNYLVASEWHVPESQRAVLIGWNNTGMAVLRQSQTPHPLFKQDYPFFPLDKFFFVMGTGSILGNLGLLLGGRGKAKAIRITDGIGTVYGITLNSLQIAADLLDSNPSAGEPNPFQPAAER